MCNYLLHVHCYGELAIMNMQIAPNIVNNSQYPLIYNSDEPRLLNEFDFIRLLDEPITYIQTYTKALKSVNAGFLLSYLVACTEPGEWFCLNGKLVKKEIGLSYDEYRLVRKKLIDLNILKNKRSASQSTYSIDDTILNQHIF